MSIPSKFATLIAVGPNPAEIDRLQDLVEAIGTYESGQSYFVMVDDAATPRDLCRDVHFPLNISPVSIRHDRATQRKGYSKGKGICSVILTGLQWIARHADDARFILKLDTDSLVIGPLAEKIAARFAADDGVGAIGAFDHTPNGDVRDIRRNAALMQAIHRPPIPWRRPRLAYRALRDRFSGGETKAVRGQISRARRNGYQFGEHCLGGGYALSGELVRRLRDNGWLDRPADWLNIDSPEDVMIGMYVKAAGLRSAGFVGENEVFGVRHEGLAYELPTLVTRGYSVIHSVKNDKRYTEKQVRDFFAHRRRQS